MDEQIPKPGDLIAGRLLVERVLGTGGMGVVLAARHQELGERVAVKMLRLPSGADGRAIERLRREARAAAKLRGEHVVRVMDVGTLDDGQPYIVMEYVSGQTVAQAREARGRVAVAEAVDWVLQACEGLAEAHGHGVVHRDIKPSNLLLSRRPDGSQLIKLLDFGIAKSLAVAPTTLTETGRFLGSPLYASPEQARDARIVDHRTDIWSLGVVLYELVTGKLPFPSYTAQAALASLMADPPVAPRTVVPELPAQLEQVLLRCLEKDPRARFGNVAELAAALAPFASDSARGAAERVARILHQAGKNTTEPPVALDEQSTQSGSQDESLAASRTAPLVVAAPSSQRAASASWRRWSVIAALALGVLLLAWISRSGTQAAPEPEQRAKATAPLSPAAPSSLPVVVAPVTAPPPPVAPVVLPVAAEAAAPTAPPAKPSPRAPTRPVVAAHPSTNASPAPPPVARSAPEEEDFGPRK